MNDIPRVIESHRLFTCSVCGWYRDLAKPAFIRDLVLDTPYGRITHEEYAQKDIRFHDCGRYERAITKLLLPKLLNRQVGEASGV
jgi:hypothetical protein